jgi:hypothetical protein
MKRQIVDTSKIGIRMAIASQTRYRATRPFSSSLTAPTRHDSQSRRCFAVSAQRHQERPSPNAVGLPREAAVGGKRFADFDLAGKTFIVTGGARGLGLALAEALVEAGGRGER